SGREWRRPAAAVGVAALVPPVVLSLAFPEGGWEPFVLSAFLPVPLAAAAAVIVLPRRERALRIGAALYGLAGIAAYAIHTPMGGNAMRLGALFAAPVLASAVRIETGLPYLRPVWRSRNWRVYAVTLPHAMAADEPGADIRAVSMGNSSVTLGVRKPGSAVVRVRWTPYWRAPGGCVEQAGDWTRVIARRPGTLRMAIDFSPVRILAHGRRCG